MFTTWALFVMTYWIFTLYIKFKEIFLHHNTYLLCKTSIYIPLFSVLFLHNLSVFLHFQLVVVTLHFHSQNSFLLTSIHWNVWQKFTNFVSKSENKEFNRFLPTFDPSCITRIFFFQISYWLISKRQSCCIKMCPKAYHSGRCTNQYL